MMFFSPRPVRGVAHRDIVFNIAWAATPPISRPSPCRITANSYCRRGARPLFSMARAMKSFVSWTELGPHSSNLEKPGMGA